MHGYKSIVTLFSLLSLADAIIAQINAFGSSLLLQCINMYLMLVLLLIPLFHLSFILLLCLLPHSNMYSNHNEAPEMPRNEKCSIPQEEHSHLFSTANSHSNTSIELNRQRVHRLSRTA
ncbi:hypothetical protein BDF14DRAFT_1845153 [Spinellus fusiger]|nr:hypothetical protein BDF14DRAFT_1845153 [Spinellus fusiger]